jgi:hypothetical protein
VNGDKQDRWIEKQDVAQNLKQNLFIFRYCLSEDLHYISWTYDNLQYLPWQLCRQAGQLSAFRYHQHQHLVPSVTQTVRNRNRF